MNESWQETITRISKPVRYSAAAALGILALFLLVQTLEAAMNFGRTDNPYMTTITVEGTGKAAMVPNIAQISFSVTESAVSVADAQTAATERTNAALDFLEEQGIEEKDVKTVAYNVYPEYETTQPCYAGYCPPTRSPEITGYQVSQTVEIKVRDTAKAGDVLQGLGNLGVQNISGPNFMVDEDDMIRNEARAEAIAQAKEKAKVLAKELGVSLGAVVSFYENTGPMPYDYYGKGGVAMDMAAESAPAPRLPTGEQETTVTVSITYEIR